MVTCWHEGEAAGNGYTTAQILSLHARCYPIFKAASPGCRYGQIVTCYTASRPSGHYPLGQWMAPGLDFYGLDGYQAASSHTVASVFGVAADQIRAKLGNVPLAVTECNSVVQPGRPEWFHDTWAWAQANKCLTYFTFWERCRFRVAVRMAAGRRGGDCRALRDQRDVEGRVAEPASASSAGPVSRCTVHSSIATAPRDS